MRNRPALLSAVAVAAVLAASLAGCAPSASEVAKAAHTASCTPYYSSGDASSTVKVTGSKTKAATADFPTPLVSKSSQVTQNDAGSGAKVLAGDQVDYEFSVFSGKTGEPLGTSGYGASGSTTPRAGVSNVMWDTGSSKFVPSHSLVRSLQCATVGERYTLVTTAKAGFGAGNLSSNGIDDSDTLVIVVSVLDRFLGKANGVNVLPKDGMPSVITAVDGQPGLVIQELAKPSGLRIETVKAGSGAVVKKGATVHVKYSGWIWPASGAKLDQPWDQSSWTANQAVDFPISSTKDGGSLPIGLYQALLGAKVGDQVLAVIPPKDGFASGAVTSIPDGSTIIMVIDVLGIK